jgi:hypothetical protein
MLILDFNFHLATFSDSNISTGYYMNDSDIPYLMMKSVKGRVKEERGTFQLAFYDNFCIVEVEVEGESRWWFVCRIIRSTHSLQSRGTSDNINQLGGNGGLTGTVVGHGQAVNHISGVLGGVLHGVTLGRHLRGVTLDQGPVDVVGEQELVVVLQDFIVQLIGSKALFLIVIAI